MSTSPESELDLDLHFLPAWAQQSPDVNRYAKYQGGEETDERRRDRRERRPGRPEGPARREMGGASGRRGPADRPAREERGPRTHPGQHRPEERREDRREPAAPLLELNVAFIPEEKGVESLARQIRLTGRAYPLFEIAFLVLRKPERYHVQLQVIKKPDGKAAQPLWVCNLDETLWLSEEAAAHHALNKHFATFYRMERLPAEPPKGAFTFVAQCGMSGTILGPPNYHDYQNKLRRLHAERFARVPFEVFKSRIKIVREEAVVKKWLEDQSWKTEYTCLLVPEPVKLGSREEVEKHFRQVHLPNVIKSVESWSLTGTAAQNMPIRPLQALIRRAWDEQMRFPIKVVNVLSQQFARHSLQFFKVNKTVTHVAVARPHYLDDAATPVSEGIKRIVDFINATPNCSRRKLMEALAPGPAPAPAPVPAAEPGTAAPAAETPVATPQMAAVISDLHWLVHEGHVIEFSSGLLETAKRPFPKPAKTEPAPSASSETPAVAVPSSPETSAAGETAQPAAEPAPPEPAPEAALPAAELVSAPSAAMVSAVPAEPPPPAPVATGEAPPDLPQPTST
ncbi:MAG: hypothetical protein HY674_15085 [Chloroflexi bacterium]|nr:hypothetical protein [Chloroflexota bacterium]